MRTMILAVFLAGALLVPAAALSETAEEAVKSMLDAAKARNWDKLASYIDFDGMGRVVKEQLEQQMKGMTEDGKKRYEEMMGATVKDLSDPAKLKERLMEEFKRDPKDFTYEIVEVKDKKDDSATVVVKTKDEDGVENQVPFPMRKIVGKWKVNFAEIPSVMEEEEEEEDEEDDEEEELDE